MKRSTNLVRPADTAASISQLDYLVFAMFRCRGWHAPLPFSARPSNSRGRRLCRDCHVLSTVFDFVLSALRALVFFSQNASAVDGMQFLCHYYKDKGDYTRASKMANGLLDYTGTVRSFLVLCLGENERIGKPDFRVWASWATHNKRSILLRAK